MSVSMMDLAEPRNVPGDVWINRAVDDETGEYFTGLARRADGDVVAHADSVSGLAVKLRQLAADILAAAEWLEAHL